MIDYQTYHGHQQYQIVAEKDKHLEQLERNGYFIIPEIFTETELVIVRQKMDAIWQQQVNEYGEKLLKDLGDFGQIRAMMLYDTFFFQFILHPLIQTYVAMILTNTAILHLQNGIVTYPEQMHNQAKFHKDFAKPFTSSRPLSLNALITIDEFSAITGGTWVIPGSHLFETMPSDHYLENNKRQLIAKAGSIIFFDSTLWHAGGTNLSTGPRRAINQQFTLPFIKQQLDYPVLLKDKIARESRLAQIMGFWTIPPKSLQEFRVTDPAQRTYRRGQG